MESKYKVFLIISIGLIILGPILGLTFDKVTLVDRTITISSDSDTNITKAYNFPFKLEKDQKLVIEFSVHYMNVTANLKILGKAQYDSAYLAESNPDILSGKDLIYTQFGFGGTQVGYSTSRSITDDGYWYCEFAGDSNYPSGYNLISLPGDYVLIVYGDNDGGPAFTDMKFDITIKIDGPGGFLESILIIIGVIVLVATLLLLTISYLNKTRRGLL